MISTAISETKVSDWTSRVLDHAILGAATTEDWKLTAYEHYKAKLNASNYPCFFGQTAELRGDMI